MHELMLYAGEVPTLRYPLSARSVRIGNSALNDLALPDEEAPPYLCAIETLPDGRHRLEDRHGSGIEVDGVRHDAHILTSGERIRLGRLVARYQAITDTAPLGQTESDPPAAQRTGLLRTGGGGELHRVDLQLRLPEHLGGRSIPIPERGLRLGASADNDVVIQDGYVSAFHAVVYVRGERLFVRDLDSTNGTFIGGVRVIEAEVRADAVLRLGQCELRVEPRESREDVAAPRGEGPWQCAELVTCDRKFAQVFSLIEKVAPHDATVLVWGETGTGKELAARALHLRSGRRSAPLVSLNCAAIPQSLIESELFGHERGAFTGADRQHKGVFEQADRGTLFLDEVGELPLDLQAKLLRVLESRTLRRVGGRGDIAVDVRVVAATHRDLVEHVRAGKFREDLLHRLYIIALTLPPLRERRSDIPFLANHLARLLAPDPASVSLSPQAAAKLSSHPFPGNVRELRNVIQRALILGNGTRIEERDIEFLSMTLEEQSRAAAIYQPGMTLEDIEREAFRQALKTYESAAEAARSLGMPKTTFWRRATALGLLEKSRGPQ